MTRLRGVEEKFQNWDVPDCIELAKQIGADTVEIP
jgi:hypothetical protein